MLTDEIIYIQIVSEVQQKSKIPDEFFLKYLSPVKKYLSNQAIYSIGSFF